MSSEASRDDSRVLLWSAHVCSDDSEGFVDVFRLNCEDADPKVLEAVEAVRKEFYDQEQTLTAAFTGLGARLTRSLRGTTGVTEFIEPRLKRIVRILEPKPEYKDIIVRLHKPDDVHSELPARSMEILHQKYFTSWNGRGGNSSGTQTVASKTTDNSE